MKSIKLLAALAIPAMFAACTQEEVFKVDTPQKMQEVVGTELIGTDISLNASMGEGTRLAGGAAGWDAEDKLGLAWAVCEAPTTSQNLNSAPNKTELVANHLFEVVDSKFETKGNIYKGWHFAYYPFAYQEEVGQKTILINSPQEVSTATDEGWFKRMSQGFHVSAMHFLTKDNLDPDTYELNKEFVMKNVLSNFVVRTNPAEGSSFTAEGALKDYQITSVTLKTGRNVFATSAKLDPTKIHRYDGTKTPKENDDLLVASFKDAFIALKKDGMEGRETSLTTEIRVEDCVVSGKNNDLVIFALPFTAAGGANMNESQVAIEIVADGGTFVIDYDGTSEKNKKALDALVAAYKNNSTDPIGLMTKDAPQTVLLDVELRNEDFVVTWDGIMDVDDWNEKVQLANDLKIEAPVFTLAAGANVVFTKEKPVIYPANGVTVKAANENDDYSGKLYIGYDCEWLTEWSDDMTLEKGVAVYVEPKCTLSVNSELTPNRLVNNGVIEAGPESTVGALGKLVNYGEVIVEYGAYVNAGKFVGVITYEVPVKYSVDEIKTLIATKGNTAGHAQVNNLKIGKDVTLDFTAPTTTPGASGSTDRYNPTAGTPDVDGAVNFGDLSGVSLVIEDGGVVKSTTTAATVNNVRIDGGKLTNITVKGYLDVKGDVEVTTASVGGSVNAVGNDQAEPVITVTGDIEGAVTATKAAVSANAIKGIVTATDATITANTIADDVTAAGETTINNADMAADLTVAKDAVVALNKVNVAGTFANDGTVTLTNEVAANVTILENNGELKSNVDINVTDVSLNPGSWTTLDSNADEVGFDKVIWYTGTYFNEDMTLQGKVAQYAAALLVEEIANAEPGATVTLKGNVNLGSNYLLIEKDLTLDLNGKTISGGNGKIAVGVKGDVNVTLTGNGTVEANGMAVGAYAGATVVIENGTYVSKGSETETFDCIYAQESTITINGGTFSNTGKFGGSGVVVNAYNGSDEYVAGEIYVNDGTFNPADGSPKWEQDDVDDGRVVLAEKFQNN